MQFPRNKSAVAFLLSAQALFETGPCYFWTFTFVKVLPDWWYPYRWTTFIRTLRNHFPLACGIRVLEAHVEHGLHYHAIINHRIPIAAMRRWADRVGMGRIGVSRCDIGAANYLAKYLIPTTAAPKLFGVNRWSTFGPWTGTHTNSIVIDSGYMRCRREVVKNEKLVIGYELLLRQAYTLGGPRRVIACFDALRNGKEQIACMLTNPHVELTPRGGLRRRRLARNQSLYESLDRTASTISYDIS